MNAADTELDRLIEGFCDGSLQAAELADLQQRLRRPAAARTFVRRMGEEQTLHRLLGAQLEWMPAPRRRQARPHRQRRAPARPRPYGLLIAAALVLGLLLPWMLAGPPVPAPDTDPDPTAAAQDPPPPDGTAADSQVLVLAAGAVRVESEPGTLLQRQGPAALRLEQGRCRVAVDPAADVAFRMQTAEATVTVLGTVFTVTRTAAVTTVTVERGQVLVRETTGAEHHLQAGAHWSSHQALLHWPLDDGQGTILREIGGAPGSLPMQAASEPGWQADSLVVASSDDIHSLRAGRSSEGLMARLNQAPALSILLRLQVLDPLSEYQLLFELIGVTEDPGAGTHEAIQARSRTPIAPTDIPITILAVFDDAGRRTYLDGRLIHSSEQDASVWRLWQSVEAKLLTPSGSHTTETELRVRFHDIRVWDRAMHPATMPADADPAPALDF
ncbi:MAG: FecR domain-containing protein [Planctomycetota bacterium]